MKSFFGTIKPFVAPQPQITYPFLWKDMGDNVFIRRRGSHPYAQGSENLKHFFDWKIAGSAEGLYEGTSAVSTGVSNNVAWSRRLRPDECVTLSNDG